MSTMQQMLRLAMVAIGLSAGTAAWASGRVVLIAGFEGAASAGMASKSQGYLGVNIRDVGDDQIAQLKLKESRGAEVTSVDHDGPAGKAGLREHDVILQMNGNVIEGEDQLRRMLRETPAGRTVTLVISRDGQVQTISTMLANRLELERQSWEQHWRVPVPSEDAANAAPAQPPVPSAPSSSSAASNGKSQSFFSPGAAARGGHALMGALSLGSSYTGAMVESMGSQLAEFFGTAGAGVLVHSVDANSPAANAGLRAGDVVVRVNTTKMTSSGDWMKMVRENRGKPVAVVVLRDKKEQTLTLIPDGKKRSSVDAEPQTDSQNRSVVVASRVGYSYR